MVNPLTRKSWSPYVVGLGIGVLSWFAFLTANHPLGITTAFENTAAIAQRAAFPTVADSNPYYAEESPKIGWEWMLVAGVFCGAWVSSQMSDDRAASVTPRLWRQRFGPSAVKRCIVAFLGGALMLFGARLAGGCTSGHGISGTLQLAISSWLFSLLFFLTAIVVAFLLYGQEGRSHV